jgi:hypothetical protein
MIAKPRQAFVEPGGEINELARREPKWQLGVGIESQRDDRLLVLECPCPFGLAPGVVADAVRGHQEKKALAFSNGVADLLVPVAARLLIAHVEPHRVRRGAAGDFVSQPPRNLFAIEP